MFRTVLRDATAGVALAGIALTAPVTLLPMKAAAQQVAANAPRTAADCDTLPTAGARIECANRLATEENRRAAAAAETRAANADARAKSADAQISCVNDISALRRDQAFGTKATEIARELVKASGRPVAELDACHLRDGIRAGLKQLKLLPGDRASLN